MHCVGKCLVFLLYVGLVLVITCELFVLLICRLAGENE